MSGAGRSTALKTLDDIGYEAFDDLPLSLVPALFESAPAYAFAIAVTVPMYEPGALPSKACSERSTRWSDGPVVSLR
jgi:RNase adaptor protein for sRNA GlmZ degradation